MTEQELQDIEAGLKRWHSMSTNTGQELINYIRELEKKLEDQIKPQGK